MNITIYHVDAFATQLFQGNPAAVCVLDDWLPDTLMQAIAAELNLPETAFVVPRGENEFRIRWFTPTMEVALCGHATLASAHVLYNHLDHEKTALRFHSQSGPLVTMPDEQGICLDFPAQYVSDIDITHEILDAVGGNPTEAFAGEDLIVMYSDASEIVLAEPNFELLEKLPYRGVCISAPGNGNGYDFVARFFAPASGIKEDPVTGSAFTKLTPIYAEKTDKRQFKARQVSARGGDVSLLLQGSRVFISGQALTVMTSSMELPGF